MPSWLSCSGHNRQAGRAYNLPESCRVRILRQSTAGGNDSFCYGECSSGRLAYGPRGACLGGVATTREIHPITKIEVFQSGTRTDLALYARSGRDTETIE